MGIMEMNWKLPFRVKVYCYVGIMENNIETTILGYRI